MQRVAAGSRGTTGLDKGSPAISQAHEDCLPPGRIARGEDTAGHEGVSSSTGQGYEDTWQEELPGSADLEYAPIGVMFGGRTCREGFGPHQTSSLVAHADRGEGAAEGSHISTPVLRDMSSPEGWLLPQHPGRLYEDLGLLGLEADGTATATPQGRETLGAF